ncbi:MAG: azoR [Moraxellaceae bacterium]|jgi:FMN-dependent NADH-azoreductase|nr:azoR [Moraxellaceae bacterium]
MQNILHLDAGLFGANSVSRVLSAAIVQRLREVHPQARVTHRDLAAAAPAHLDAGVLGAAEEAALSQQLIDELFAADTIVIGAPMYNFSIPTQLRAWFDRVLKAGVTFRYTDQGAVGLAGGRRVIIASARGGAYGENSPADFQEPYLRQLLSFIGITDVEVIRAEGVALGDAARTAAVAQALAQVARLDALAGAA